MPNFDGAPYTEMTEPHDDDVIGVCKDVSEVDPVNQTKFMFFSTLKAWIHSGVGGIATALRETSGPTNLDLGEVEDGEVLKRIGTEIVGMAAVDYAVSNDASSATPTPIGSAKRNEYYLTALATNPTFAEPSGTPANGNMILIRYKDNGTGRTIAWNPIYRNLVGMLPLFTTANKTGYVLVVYNSAATKYDCLAAGVEV